MRTTPRGTGSGTEPAEVPRPRCTIMFLIAVLVGIGQSPGVETLMCCPPAPCVSYKREWVTLRAA